MDNIKREQLNSFAIELIPVEEWLRDGARHATDGLGFNMETMHSTSDNEYDYNENECGTAMCIAGAAGQFNKIKNPSNADIYYKEKYPEIEGELEELFYPDYWEDTNGYPIDPQQALQAIENFKENGDPRWAKVLGREE